MMTHQAFTQRRRELLEQIDECTRMARAFDYTEAVLRKDGDTAQAEVARAEASQYRRQLKNALLSYQAVTHG